MSKSRRIQKVASLLRKEISLILMNDLEDGLIVDNFVSITQIELSIDLQHSRVYVTSSANDATQNDIVERLNIYKSNIRYILSKRIQMRRVPEIVFKKDKVLNEGLSVLKVLDKLRDQNQEALDHEGNAKK